MLLIAQTIGAATANANNRKGFPSSDCNEAAKLARAEQRKRRDGPRKLTVAKTPVQGECEAILERPVRFDPFCDVAVRLCENE